MRERGVRFHVADFSEVPMKLVTSPSSRTLTWTRSKATIMMEAPGFAHPTEFFTTTAVQAAFQ